MSGDEQQYIHEAFRSNWLTSAGSNLDAFERDISALLDGRHTLAVSSGTAALHLVLRYLGVGPGDDVVVSTLTFAGSVFPIQYLGARPVFLDSERHSGNMDPALLATYLADSARRGTLPKAVVAVHLYGQHADIDAIKAHCDAHGVPLVEDAAESLGASYRGRPTATTADFSILSFNGNKIITTTGGGMVVARDAEAVARMRKWSTQSREPAIEYVHCELGYNYRLSNVLAGIGRGQLHVLAQRVSERRAVAARYAAAFEGVAGVELQREAEWGVHSRWLSVVYLDRSLVGITPRDVVAALAEDNIEARPVWRPMHTQPLYKEAPVVGGAVAELLFDTGVCLPSSSSLTREEQQRVVSAFLGAVARG
jgi:pyridoxal phosphate-dependent aminotransferase EpsN